MGSGECAVRRHETVSVRPQANQRATTSDTQVRRYDG
eukprot:COSAG02_NODE_38879_length_423_cov_3.209877_1_plen_36_part_10